MADLNHQIHELRSTLGKMEIALGTVDEGIVWTDNRGRIQWCNSTFDKLVKKTHILILGQQLTDLLHLSQNGVAVEKKLHPVMQALEGKSKGKDQYEFGGDDSRLVLEISWSYLQMPSSSQEDSDISSAVIVIHDITERKAAEIFLQEAKRKLEQRVQERTQELILLNRQLFEHNLELEEARKVAENASQVKSEFLATMSHEIRTPLNAVIGLAELLSNTELDATQLDFVNTIQSSGEMLLTLINDILDFSKIEAGELKLTQEVCDLKSIIDSCIDIIHFPAIAKKLKLDYLIASPTPNLIICDANRLSQILLNILNNAVKFTESGEVYLSLKSRKLDNSQETVSISSPSTYELEFCVRDTGIGIPSGKVNQLFQPFKQLDASMSRKYGGTGLGLAITKRLVEMMGGKIWAESHKGIGSKFFFTVIVSESVPLPVENSSNQENNNSDRNLIGKQILFIDNSIYQKSIIQQTQGWGMLNCAVSTGEEALTFITKGIKFDLIILDSESLDMDGMYLIKEMRQQYSWGKIPIIILSSPLQPEYDIPNSDNDAIFIIKKPIQESQLYELLQNLFREKQITQNQITNIKTPAKPMVTQHQSLRILLAEDNLVNQKVALLVLKKIGYCADVANNGLEVLEALQKQTYDVVLMDVQMPEMDGLTATQKICQKWSNSERPRIIALTANAMPGDREMCLNAGMDDYLAKPIRAENLQIALSKC
ncbi:PAS domain-containing hybrid sensor histidine kinase/response regulator [Calothrix sp. 336/3]|uniref:PAS domain-containing hybrid sensor histidine kinase/response regulator n=1 Tax=Calothrix sp. 336/3 TaxID=1337936 RepID=UPI00069C3942|nr:PAS domain-containing hybrid sensor histidine kinase/response regulator [Calothrix sp. 336/3]